MDNKATGLSDTFHFDAEWYLATYPDVALVGMDPALHYLHYGRAMGRAPSAAFLAAPRRAEALTLPKPRPGRELLEAYNIAKRGDHDLSLAFADLHVPKYLAYTVEPLRANAALARGDEASWLGHLNAYLANFDTVPLRLKAGAQLLERLSTDSLPPVTGGPLVSVIMPAWNAEKTIAAAAGSILEQTWRNLELIILDDASDDDTWGVMQQISASDSRVRIQRNKINVGPYVSKNLALAFAAGEWITGQDADDWAHPQRLERHLNAVLQDLSTPRASVTYMARLDPNGNFDAFSALNAFSFDGATRISSISALFNSRFLKEEIGFWDGVRFGGDSEMISRVKRVLGEEFKEFQQIGMLCMSFKQSLTNDPINGVRANKGTLSTARTTYRNSWLSVHEQALRDNLYLPFPNENRRYETVKEMVVPYEDIMANLLALKRA